MAIASPAAPTFAASAFNCSRSESTLPSFATTRSAQSVLRFSPISTRSPIRQRLTPVVTSQLNDPSSTPSNNYDGDLQYELQHGLSMPLHRLGRGSTVFVTLPLDAVSSTNGQMKRRKVMGQSFRALAAAGVEGVVMEVWWGIVEKESPRVYNWQAYFEIVVLAKYFGLKVRAVMAFHQCGSGPNDPFWIPLPQWVLEDMEKDPDLAFSDRFGRRSKEYISLGCDNLPILHGRSPIQAYADFMRNFRDTFRPFFGGVITGIQVGMGPDGELRYPSCPSQKLRWAWRSRELGEFQCYDKYMLASLNACAEDIGMHEWGNGGPSGAFNLMHNPESTEFFRKDGSWSTTYGEFFLQWYSEMLLLHGERICREADIIFRGSEISTSGKLAGIHWHYGTQSHAAELTAGYYNTAIRDGYLPIARMFSRYGFTMCCPCFDMQDVDEQQINPHSRPEVFLKQLLNAARFCGIPFEGENSATKLDEGSFQQVLKMSKFYSDGLDAPCFSFNFIRMDKNLFDPHNWVSFTRFVRQMSEANLFRAKLEFGGGDETSSQAAACIAGALIAC